MIFSCVMFCLEMDVTSRIHFYAHWSMPCFYCIFLTEMMKNFRDRDREREKKVCGVCFKGKKAEVWMHVIHPKQ